MMTARFIKLSTTVGLRFGPVRQGVTPKRILEFVLQDMSRLQDDYGISTEPEVVCRIRGMFEAYRNVAHYIAPLTVVNGSGNGNGHKIIHAIASTNGSTPK